jgi:methylphosphotriester-DNA--protein-cysteine methyltransferase
MPPYMLLHSTLTSRALKSLLRKGQILFGGNRRLKIYGTLRCASGRRMKMANRVFFATEQEAIDAGYRPCGHCMKNAYTQWKKQNT